MILSLYNVGFDCELNCLLKPFYYLEGTVVAILCECRGQTKEMAYMMFHDIHFLSGLKLLVTDLKELGHVTTYQASGTTF
jgi:hypothetical protein